MIVLVSVAIATDVTPEPVMVILVHPRAKPA
jgi:hypothetical protein